MDWSGVEYLWIIVMFLSTVWTLILTAPIHCRASIGEQVMWWQISPNLLWWRTKLFSILDALRQSIFSASFHFWVNYSFNKWIAMPFHPPTRTGAVCMIVRWGTASDEISTLGKPNNYKHFVVCFVSFKHSEEILYSFWNIYVIFALLRYKNKHQKMRLAKK